MAARLERQTIPTFRQAATSAHEELVAGWRNGKHREDWLSSLRAYAFPSLGSIRIDLIDAPMVRDLLLPIWLEKPETARRVRQRVRSIKDWAVECTSFPDAVSEAALAHMDANRVRAAYRRTDILKMRADLMAAWARHLEGDGDDAVSITQPATSKLHKRFRHHHASGSRRQATEMHPFLDKARRGALPVGGGV